MSNCGLYLVYSLIHIWCNSVARRLTVLNIGITLIEKLTEDLSDVYNATLYGYDVFVL